MDISSAQIKQLRDQTGISVMQCKKALDESGGDLEKAAIILKRKSTEAAEKKSERALGAGAVGVYTHNTNELAAMVVLACETDFVSKNEEFVTLAREVAMHVAAVNPTYTAREEVPADVLKKAEEVFSAEIKDTPADLHEKIMSGKLDAYFKDQILLEQPFVKNPDVTVGDLIKEAIQKFGENVQVVTFSRLTVK